MLLSNSSNINQISGRISDIFWPDTRYLVKLMDTGYPAKLSDTEYSAKLLDTGYLVFKKPDTGYLDIQQKSISSQP